MIDAVDGRGLYWSDELEELHEEDSRTHFLDRWTRLAILLRMERLRANATIIDVGCSSGYLLEDLRTKYHDARLIGLDLVFAGLTLARSNGPVAAVLQGDACALPLADRTADAIVSANLLEHVPNDVGALAEMRRVLRPGRLAILVVPTGRGTFDYYDRYLRHQRRYGRGELETKARTVGLEVLDQAYLGSLIFPPFWLTKKMNRVRFGHLAGDELKRRAALDIARTKDSRVGHISTAIERRMLDKGVRFPFGVREVVTLRRPVDTSAGAS